MAKKRKKALYKRVLPGYQKVSRRAWLSAGLLIVFGLAVIFYLHAAQENIAWPNLYHKTGAYSTPLASDVPLFTSTGFSLMLSPYVDPASDLGRQLTSNKLSYIDTTIEQLIYGEYQNDYQAVHPGAHCYDDPGGCTITPDQETDLLKRIDTWLSKTKDDQRIVAYYILDDYWTNMRDVLDKAAAKIAATNAKAPFQRPTICAFGASIDWTVVPDTFAKKLTNYSPTICNIPAFYVYGHEGTDPDSVSQEDWTMSQVLPSLKATFAKAGWRGTAFIGIPQAFSDPTNHNNVRYSTATPATIATQTEAFCKYGATTIMPFTWRSPSPFNTLAQGDPQVSLAYRQGYQAGVAGCDKYWYPDQIKALRKAGTSAINQRLPKLTDLITRVKKSDLDQTQKDTLVTFLNSQIDGLKKLKDRIKTDDTIASLQADNPDIADNFLVYKFTLPKTGLMLQSARDLDTIASSLTKIADFEKKHGSLKTMPLRNQLNTLRAQVIGIQKQVLPVTLDQFKANTQILTTQSTALAQIERLIKSIQDQLKALGA